MQMYEFKCQVPQMSYLDEQRVAVVDEGDVSQPTNPVRDVGHKEASDQDLQMIATLMHDSARTLPGGGQEVCGRDQIKDKAAFNLLQDMTERSRAEGDASS